jgi:hypothetical protein
MLHIAPSKPKKSVPQLKSQKFYDSNQILDFEEEQTNSLVKAIDQWDTIPGHKRSFTLKMLHIARNIEFHTSLQAQK